MDVTVQGGTKKGTSGNDNLYTLVISYNSKTDTRTFTYYKRLNGLAGDDTLYNSQTSISPVTLDGGDGNDKIENLRGGHKGLILGGNGNDCIYNGEYNQGNNYVTINAGTGDDYIYHYGKNVSMLGGDGSDTIYGYNSSNASIDAGKGHDYISNTGSKSSIKGGTGNDTIYNYGDNSTLWGDAGDDNISGYGSKVTVYGGKGNDTLKGGGNNSESLGANILLDDTIGTNYFSLAYTKKSSLLSGAGSDSVSMEGNNKALIKLGEGNNSLSSRSDKNSTIVSGSGNDNLIFYNATNLSVNSGDGDNCINFRDSSYSINSTKNKILSGKGNDIVVNNSNYVSISTGAGNDSINHIGANSTVRGGSGDDWIYNNDGERDYGHNNSISSFNLIDGGTGNDTIENACDNVTLVGGSGNDYLSSGGVDKVSMVGGNGNDTIYNVTDINVQLSTNSTLIGGAGNDYIYNTGNDVTITGGTGNDTIRLGAALAGRRPARYEVGGENILINYTTGDGFDLIQGFDSKATLSVSGGTYSTKKSGDNLIVTVGKGKITLEGAASLEAPNITTDFLSVNDKTTSPVTVDSDIKTISAAKRTKAVKITGNKIANTIRGGSANDTLLGGKGNDILKGDAGNDKLYGNAGNDSLYGLAGNDSLSGNAGNDLLTGGDGSDLFVYAAGNDTIGDYTAYDEISLGAAISKTILNGSEVVFTLGTGSLTVQNGKGKTLNITDSAGKKYSTVVGGTTLTLTDAATSPVTAASSIKVINASKRTTAIKIKGNKLDNTIRGGSANDTISGAAGNDSLNGNAGNDKLYGLAGNDSLSGGKGNDILIGGAGNDSLWGDAGADKFIYSSGDGFDIIYGFEDKDTLTLDGLDFKATYKNEALTLTVSNGSITLKDFTATTFHINDDTYQISGKKLAVS
ncbi:MAG: hypothetical protein IKO74_06960 [Selenomonadaceae bacterium]|nr:hypothetical protein [Selenomonadaceae bacterium]